MNYKKCWDELLEKGEISGDEIDGFLFQECVLVGKREKNDRHCAGAYILLCSFSMLSCYEVSALHLPTRSFRVYSTYHQTGPCADTPMPMLPRLMV